MIVLFTYHYGDEAFDEIRKMGFAVHYCSEATVSTFDALAQVEILVCYNPFNQLDLALMPNLKYIFLSSAGIDQLPKPVVDERAITVTNNRGGYSIPIGEWVLWTTLSIYKNAKHFYQNQSQGKWLLSTQLFELFGKKVGIIGTGSIGCECAKRFAGFGVDLIGFNTTGSSVKPFDQVYSIEALDHIIETLDILVISVPYTEMTHGLLNGSRLQAMKNQSVLINVSRGAIISEQALLEMLESGKFLGVGLDVFDQEPLPENHPLWHIERAFVTPHNSWVSERRNERRFEVLRENFKRLQEGKQLLNLVDVKRGY